MSGLPVGAYSGELYGRLRHGQGSYEYSNRYFRYDGQWDMGRKSGTGVFSMGDGSRYEGEFVEGEIEGQGIRRWPDGGAYKGEFHRGELDGRGGLVAPHALDVLRVPDVP